MTATLVRESMFTLRLRGCDNDTRFDELRVWGGWSSLG